MTLRNTLTDLTVQLDVLGLYKEVDEIDNIIRTAAELDPHKEEEIAETFEPTDEKPSPYTREEWKGDKENLSTKKGPSRDAQRVALKYRLKKMFPPAIDRYLTDKRLDEILAFLAGNELNSVDIDTLRKLIVGGLSQPKWSGDIKVLQDIKRNLMNLFKTMPWGTELTPYISPKFLKYVFDDYGAGAIYSNTEKDEMYHELLGNMFRDRLRHSKCVNCGSETGSDYLTKTLPTEEKESEDIISSPLCDKCLAKPLNPLLEEFLEAYTPEAMERLVEMHEDITDPSEIEERFSYPEEADEWTREYEENKGWIYPEDRATAKLIVTELTKIANDLDKKGLYKKADEIDIVIKKIAASIATVNSLIRAIKDHDQEKAMSLTSHITADDFQMTDQEFKTFLNAIKSGHLQIARFLLGIPDTDEDPSLGRPTVSPHLKDIFVEKNCAICGTEEDLIKVKVGGQDMWWCKECWKNMSQQKKEDIDPEEQKQLDELTKHF